MNEWMHQTGLLPQDKYITQSRYVMSMVITLILFIAYKKIVLESDWYENFKDSIEDYEMKAAFGVVAIYAIALLSMALYFKEYGLILFFISMVVIILTIAIRKEFAGLRRFLDEKFGWMF